MAVIAELDGVVDSEVVKEYGASIIAKWQSEKNHSKLKQLSKDLERLGLTWKVTAKRINDALVAYEAALKSGDSLLIMYTSIAVHAARTNKKDTVAVNRVFRNTRTEPNA